MIKIVLVTTILGGSPNKKLIHKRIRWIVKHPDFNLVFASRWLQIDEQWKNLVVYGILRIILPSYFGIIIGHEIRIPINQPGWLMECQPRVSVQHCSCSFFNLQLQWIYNYTTSSRKMFRSMYDFPFFNWTMFMIFGDCSFNDDLPWKLSNISAVHLFSPSQKRRAQTVPGVKSAYTDRFDYIGVLVHN